MKMSSIIAALLSPQRCPPVSLSCRESVEVAWKEGGLLFWGGAGSRDSPRNFLGSGTNVTGEPHQSAPQRFDYCQKRQQGGKKYKTQKEKKGFQLEATLQSCRGRERSERLSCDREKELLLHNTSPPVGLYYRFLILFFSKYTSNNSTSWTFKVFYRENQPNLM